MNKSKIILVLGGGLMLLTTTLKASVDQPLNFGLKAGGSMSFLKGLDQKRFQDAAGTDKKVDTSSKFFVTAGANFSYAFHENIGVGVEVLYLGLGGSVKPQKDSANKDTNQAPDSATKKGNDSFTICTHNLAIPIMARIFPMGCDPQEGILALNVGAQFTFPLSGKIIKEDTTTDDKDFKKEYLNAATLGLLAGVSYEIPGIGLVLEGRYTYELNGIFKDNEDAKKYKKTLGFKGEKDDLKLINHYATVCLGYNFARLLS